MFQHNKFVHVGAPVRVCVMRAFFATVEVILFRVSTGVFLTLLSCVNNFLLFWRIGELLLNIMNTYIHTYMHGYRYMHMHTIIIYLLANMHAHMHMHMDAHMHMFLHVRQNTEIYILFFGSSL